MASSMSNTPAPISDAASAPPRSGEPQTTPEEAASIPPEQPPPGATTATLQPSQQQTDPPGFIGASQPSSSGKIATEQSLLDKVGNWFKPWFGKPEQRKSPPSPQKRDSENRDSLGGDRDSLGVDVNMETPRTATVKPAPPAGPPPVTPRQDNATASAMPQLSSASGPDAPPAAMSAGLATNAVPMPISNGDGQVLSVGQQPQAAPPAPHPISTDLDGASAGAIPFSTGIAPTTPAGLVPSDGASPGGSGSPPHSGDDLAMRQNLQPSVAHVPREASGGDASASSSLAGAGLPISSSAAAPPSASCSDSAGAAPGHAFAPPAQLVHGSVLGTSASVGSGQGAPRGDADALGSMSTGLSSMAGDPALLGQGLLAGGPSFVPHGATDPVAEDTALAAAAHDLAALDPLRQQMLGTGVTVLADAGRGSRRDGGAPGVTPIDESERVALVKHLNWALKGDPHTGDVVPMDPSGDAVFKAAAPGVLLSKFVLRVAPAALDPRALNLPQGRPLGSDAKLQNQTLCLNAVTAVGCGVQGLSPRQLVDAPSHQQGTLQLVWNLTRSALLGPIKTSKMPQLNGLCLVGEDPAVLAKYRPEQVLLRWVNHHIRGYLEASPEQAAVPRTFRVTNLHADLADALALAIVLHQVLPHRSAAWDAACAALGASSTSERAEGVLEAARLGGVEMFEPQAGDLTAPRPRMLLAFVAAIFHTHPGLVEQPAAPKAAKARRALRSNPSQAREEAALRMWMASLGLGLESLSSLYEDCRDGVAFLRLVDFIKPGTIDWSRVLLEPRSIYERVQNCNHAVRAARFLGLVVEGFSGKDLADGISMYILSMASQLMRAHVCLFLDELGLGEGDVLEWANCQVRRHDDAFEMRLRGFADAQIRTGVFVLRLLRAVAPECTREELILPGDTEEERAQNARYAISCAHKAGCTVFATWEDVIEGRPRMILCLLAALMAEDLRRHEEESQAAPAA